MAKGKIRTNKRGLPARPSVSHKKKKESSKKRLPQESKTMDEVKRRKIIYEKEQVVKAGQEDADFYQENIDFMNFFVNLDVNKLKPNNVSKKGSSKCKRSSSEENYEKNPRSFKNSNTDGDDDDDIEELKRLPLKDGSKIIEQKLNKADIEDQLRLQRIKEEKQRRLLEKEARIKTKLEAKKAQKKMEIESSSLSSSQDSQEESSLDNSCDRDGEMDYFSCYERDIMAEEISGSSFFGKQKNNLAKSNFKPDSEINADDDFAEIKILLNREQELSKKKEIIGKLSMEVTSNPDENIKNLCKLNEFCNDGDITVKKLAILSLLAIYLDIIPSYRIITFEDDNNNEKLTKEVRKLRKYESALLSHYQLYLKTLEGFIRFDSKKKGKKNDDESNTKDFTQEIYETYQRIRYIAIECLGKLLAKNPHFNFRTNIIVLIVPLLNSDDPKVVEYSQNAIKNLFEQEKIFVASMEAVKAITRYIKKRNYKVRDSVIKVISHLKFTKALEPGDSIFKKSSLYSKKKIEQHLSRRKKKEMKKQKDIDKKIAEASTFEEREKINYAQTELLKAAFLLYFHIIKKAPDSNLFPAALEGMAQYSHLINIELLTNLIQVLERTIGSKGISLDSSIYCVVTAFQAIKLQGESLIVDLKDFYKHFYKLLEPLLLDSSKHHKLMPLAFRALELILTKTKVYSLDRIAAFTKRILSLILHFAPQFSLPLLMFIVQIVNRYPKIQKLMDSEYQASGIYMPDIDDPDHCNPFASAFWEFVLLYKHYHPSVVNLAQRAYQLETILEQNIHGIYEKFDWLKNGYVPAMAPPKEHVFLKTISRKQKKGLAKPELFIQPSFSFNRSKFLKSLLIESRKWDSKIPDFKGHYQSMVDENEGIMILQN